MMKYIISILLLYNNALIAQCNIPFCSFKQLGKSNTTYVNYFKPILISTSYYNPISSSEEIIVDSSAVIKTFMLSSRFSIKHKWPSLDARLKGYIHDTIYIGCQAFDIQEALQTSRINPSVVGVYIIEETNQKYLILKIIDISGGADKSCYLLAFNVNDSRQIRCINVLSNISGATWLVKENLITDYNLDGRAELTLYGDKRTICSYALFPDRLVKQKYIAFKQVGDNLFYIDTLNSDWYFDLKEMAPSKDCKFQFSSVKNVYNE